MQERAVTMPLDTAAARDDGPVAARRLSGRKGLTAPGTLAGEALLDAGFAALLGSAGPGWAVPQAPGTPAGGTGGTSGAGETQEVLATGVEGPAAHPFPLEGGWAVSPTSGGFPALTLFRMDPVGGPVGEGRDPALGGILGEPARDRTPAGSPLPEVGMGAHPRPGRAGLTAAGVTGDILPPTLDSPGQVGRASDGSPLTRGPAGRGGRAVFRETGPGRELSAAGVKTERNGETVEVLGSPAGEPLPGAPARPEGSAGDALTGRASIREPAAAVPAAEDQALAREIKGAPGKSSAHGTGDPDRQAFPGSPDRPATEARVGAYEGSGSQPAGDFPGAGSEGSPGETRDAYPGTTWVVGEVTRRDRAPETHRERAGVDAPITRPPGTLDPTAFTGEARGAYAFHRSVAIPRWRELLDQVAGAVRLAREGEATQARIRLHPPQLGSLKVEAEWSGALKVRLEVHDPRALQALEPGLSDLRQHLLSQGLPLQELQLVLEGGSGGGRSAGERRDHRQDPASPKEELEPAAARHLWRLGNLDLLV